jgi:hypothetical protein
MGLLYKPDPVTGGWMAKPVMLPAGVRAPMPGHMPMIPAPVGWMPSMQRPKPVKKNFAEKIIGVAKKGENAAFGMEFGKN